MKWANCSPGDKPFTGNVLRIFRMRSVVVCNRPSMSAPAVCPVENVSRDHLRAQKEPTVRCNLTQTRCLKYSGLLRAVSDLTEMVSDVAGSSVCRMEKVWIRDWTFFLIAWLIIASRLLQLVTLLFSLIPSKVIEEMWPLKCAELLLIYTELRLWGWNKSACSRREWCYHMLNLKYFLKYYISPASEIKLILFLKRANKKNQNRRNAATWGFSLITPQGRCHFLWSTQICPADVDVDVLLSTTLLLAS